MAPADSDVPARLTAVPPERRSSVLIRSLADLFNIMPEHLPEDRDRFEALFRPLYQEADAADRAHVAHLLSRRRDLPASIARDILADEDDIAATFAATGQSLDETLLVAAVGRPEASIRLAIAARDDLPEAVVLALLAVGENEVILALADNPTAEIPHDLLDALEADARMLRQSADKGVAELDRFLGLDEAERFRFLAGFTAETALRQVEAATHGAPPRHPPADLFTRAVSGDRAAVASMLAAELGLDARTTRRLVDDAGGEPLAVVLAAIGADSTLATSLMLWLLPEASRSYWRLGLLRGLHADIGWRAAAALVDIWSGRKPVSRRVEAPAVKAALRQSKDAAARRAGEAPATPRRTGTRH